MSAYPIAFVNKKGGLLRDRNIVLIMSTLLPVAQGMLCDSKQTSIICVIVTRPALIY